MPQLRRDEAPGKAGVRVDRYLQWTPMEADETQRPNSEKISLGSSWPMDGSDICYRPMLLRKDHHAHTLVDRGLFWKTLRNSIAKHVWRRKLDGSLDQRAAPEKNLSKTVIYGIQIKRILHLNKVAGSHVRSESKKTTLFGVCTLSMYPSYLRPRYVSMLGSLGFLPGKRPRALREVERLTCKFAIKPTWLWSPLTRAATSCI